MGLRPLRMKVRWGCPLRVWSPLPHRTQSWRPCLPGQPRASGWRSTDHPVPSPRGWMIGFSERDAAHNRALLRCLSSRRCMRSWRSRGWPLSRPEAARLSPPSSLPSTAGLPGGTRAFPRWRERSRCTCARETPPLGGIVRVSRPKPVSWRLLWQPKLIVLRARQPLPCMPWRSCRFTKPRHSNRCTRVVPTRGWCRSCARRLTSLYERRKSRRGPSGRRCPLWWSKSAISGSTWRRWRTSTKHAFSTLPSPRLGCSATLSRALPSSSRQCRSRPRRSSTSCHGGVRRQRRLPLGPDLRLLVAVDALLRPPEPLRPVLKRKLGRRVEPLAGARRPPRPIRAPNRPGGRRSGPDAGNPEMLEFALSQETTRKASLLPPVEDWVENPMFPFISVLFISGTHIFKERAISFSSGISGPRADSVRRIASSLSPATHFASGQESAVRGRSTSPRTSSQSPLGPREFCRTHCLLYHPALLPFAAPPQVRRLYRWSHLHGVWKRGLPCPARLVGSRAQFDSATRFSSPGDLPSSAAFSRPRWELRTLLSCARRLLSSWQRVQSSRSLQPRWGRGFTALTSSYPRKVVVFDQSWICDSWTGPCTGSRSRCWHTGVWSNAYSPGIGLQRSTWRMLTFMFRSFPDTDRSYGLRSKVGHGSTGSSPSGSPSLPVSSRRL